MYLFCHVCLYKGPYKIKLTVAFLFDVFSWRICLDAIRQNHLNVLKQVSVFVNQVIPYSFDLIEPHRGFFLPKMYFSHNWTLFKNIFQFLLKSSSWNLENWISWRISLLQTPYPIPKTSWDISDFTLCTLKFDKSSALFFVIAKLYPEVSLYFDGR